MQDVTDINAIQRSFKRREKKFLLDASQYDLLWSRINSRLLADVYGRTIVMSIYFDNDNYELFSKSADKPNYKEKFRLRCYGIPTDDSTVFAEIKKKYDGIVYKRRIEGRYQDILDMMSGRCELPHDVQIQKEILWMKRRYSLEPKAFIGYDRDAYTCPSDPGLRVTFDSNIRYRLNDLDLRSGDYGDLLIDKDFRLMEVKAPGNLPLWFSEALTACGIHSGSFSKIGTCYKEIIIPGLRSGSENERRLKNA